MTLGLRLRSRVMADKPVTIRRERLGRRIGRLAAAQWRFAGRWNMRWSNAVAGAPRRGSAMGENARCWAHRAAVCLAAVTAMILQTHKADAYSAAGDRLFPATLQLPQLSPGDEFYMWADTQPLSGGPAGAGTRTTGVAAIWGKTLTERLGIVIEENWTRLDRVKKSTWSGMQNLDTEIKYLAVVDQPHEFLMTVGVDREWGGTGAQRVGAFAAGATTPRVYFGKGLGDLDIGRLRPLAVTGLVGYQAADAAPRPDVLQAGLVVEYSIPYLESKVESLDLPEPLRGLTPMTETLLTTPVGKTYGENTTLLVAPGVSYAGAGWELAFELLVPATTATGRGVGAIAQFHLSLDYVAGETIGHPLFAQQ